jgi:hypothetical protein
MLNNISPAIVVMWDKIIYFIMMMNGKWEVRLLFPTKPGKLWGLKLVNTQLQFKTRTPICTKLEMK